MELHEYFSVARKYWLLLVTTTLVLLVASLGFRALQPDSFKASRALTISRVNIQETQDYKFDNYYTIQASELFGRTVIGWLETPANVLDIYEDAGIAAPTNNLNALARTVDATRIAPQVIQIEFTHGNADEAKKIADSVVRIVEREISKENSQENTDAFFHAEASETVVVESEKYYALIAIASIVVGLFLSYNVALLLNYLAKHRKA